MDQKPVTDYSSNECLRKDLNNSIEDIEMLQHRYITLLTRMDEIKDLLMVLNDRMAAYER